MEMPSLYTELECSAEEARRPSCAAICLEKEGIEDGFTALEGENRKSPEDVGKCEELAPPKADISSEIFANKLFCAGGIARNAMEARKMLPATEEEMAFTQGNGVAGDGYNSRFLLSVPLVTSRGKKKRRSRASVKAPIKMFATDVSNFMAMVHELTGIPSHTSPLHSPVSPSKLLPFIQQGLPTLDTSTMLLNSRSCDLSSNGNSFSLQQHLGFPYLDVMPTGHVGQLQAVINSNPSSIFGLMRSMCSTSSLSLWESSYMKQNNATHKVPESGGDGGEGEGAASISSLPISGNVTPSFEALLAGHERLARTDTWPSAMGSLVSNVAKKELS